MLEKSNFSSLKICLLPNYPKRRQKKLYLSGASPLMHKSRINSFNNAHFGKNLQAVSEKEFN
jgi:hypothetical protein